MKSPRTASCCAVAGTNRWIVLEHTNTEHHCPREIATFSLFGDSKNSAPRPEAPALEAAIDTTVTGAC